MEVKVIRLMPEFGFYPGKVVNVTPGQYKNFMEKYKCFEENTQNRLITVRVKVNMHRKYGWDGWFPNTIQLGSVGELQKYIDSGELELADNPKPQKERYDYVKTGNTQLDKPRAWTFFEDFGEYKKGQTVWMTTLEMQIGNKLYHAVNWDKLRDKNKEDE